MATYKANAFEYYLKKYFFSKNSTQNHCHENYFFRGFKDLHLTNSANICPYFEQLSTRKSHSRCTVIALVHLTCVAQKEQYLKTRCLLNVCLLFCWCRCFKFC